MRILRKIFGLHPVAFLLVCLVPAVLIANLTAHTEALLDALLMHIDTDADGNITDESPTYVAVSVDTEAYDATGWEADFTVPTKDAVRDKIEAIPTGGDITTVLSDETGDVVRLFQTAAAFVDADATPDVSGGTVFITANTGATTITDFDTSLVDGHMIFIIVNDANTTFDLTSSGLEGTGGKDYAAANGDLVIAVYSTTDSQWHMIFWPSTIGAVSLQEGITWTDGDGTGSLAWAFAFGAARTITIPGDADQTLATANSTTTFTNKTYDVDGTGNVLSNLDEGNMTAAAVLKHRRYHQTAHFDPDNQYATYGGILVLDPVTAAAITIMSSKGLDASTIGVGLRNVAALCAAFRGARLLRYTDADAVDPRRHHRSYGIRLHPDRTRKGPATRQGGLQARS